MSYQEFELPETEAVEGEVYRIDVRMEGRLLVERYNGELVIRGSEEFGHGWVQTVRYEPAAESLYQFPGYQGLEGLVWDHTRRVVTFSVLESEVLEGLPDGQTVFGTTRRRPRRRPY